MRLRLTFNWPDGDEDGLREALNPLSDAIKARKDEIDTLIDKHPFNVAPDYTSINTVVECCEPWIDLWGGDEWGDSMRNLAAATHTNYGFSDEDCALFASKLLENLIAQKEWMDGEGREYGLSEPEDEARARAEAREKRDYWLKGGNLTVPEGQESEKARAMVDLLPRWMFDDAQEKLF